MDAFAQLPAITPTTYRMRSMAANYDLSTQDGRTEYAKACAPLIQRLEPVERENHLQELVVQTGFAPEVLREQIGAALPPPATDTKRPLRPTPRSSEPVNADLEAQKKLIAILSTGRITKDVVRLQDFEDPMLKSIYERLLEGMSPASIVEEQPTEQLRTQVSNVLLSPICEDTNQLIDMTEECLATLREERRKRRIEELKAKLPTLTASERSSAMNEIAQLLAQRKRPL